MPQITINIPAAAVPRIKAATRQFFPSGFDPESGQDHPEPTDAEYIAFVKAEIKRYLQREVRDFEQREAARAAQEAVTDIEVLD